MGVNRYYAEPVTSITDYILAVELVVICLFLLRPSRRKANWNAACFWAAGLALLGVATALGGIEHGFAIPLKCEGRDTCIESSWVWIATLLTQTPALSSCAIGAAFLVLDSGCARCTVIFIAIINWMLMHIVYVAMVLAGCILSKDMASFMLTFRAITAFSAPTMLMVLVLFLRAACSCKAGGEPASKGSSAALVGWIVVLLAVVWNAAGISFNAEFNHNDISHVIFIVGYAITGYGLHAWLAVSRHASDDLEDLDDK